MNKPAKKPQVWLKTLFNAMLFMLENLHNFLWAIKRATHRKIQFLSRGIDAQLLLIVCAQIK